MRRWAAFRRFLWQHRMLVFLLAILGSGLFIWSQSRSIPQTPQYQTSQVERGTLVISVTASGQVVVANKSPISTQASGMIREVYVRNGDTVAEGDKIADITLDTNGQERQSQAYAAYLSAQNSLNQAQAQMYTLQNGLFVANQKFVTDRGVANPTDQQKADPIYIEEDAAWLAAEAAYKNQTTAIAQAQAALNSAWLSYQAVSSTITAPTSGTVSDVTIVPGMQVSGSNSTTSSSSNTGSTGSSSSGASSSLGSISNGGPPVVSVDIAEVDVPSVHTGDKVTLTFDSLADKTFTGKVIGIDTTGSVSLGVTTYPATIQLDDTNNTIYPNMSATANIITGVKDNVLLVPSSAVQTSNGESVVRVLNKNGIVSTVPVQVGDSSNSQTEITLGLNEGQTVIISSLTTGTAGTGGSPFSAGLGGFGRGGGGGGNARFIGR